MCGVIGYVGPGAAPSVFFNGLKRLEYRGYDSAGIAMLTQDGVFIERAEGKLSELEKKLSRLPARAGIGIGHTRWATHGRPSENNAHPHRSGKIVLLHNGIIENYRVLKEMLIQKGFMFSSETDTEVAAHLLAWEYDSEPTIKPPFERMKSALQRTVRELKGAFAFGILCTDTPDVLYVAKMGSPMVVGIGQGENYMASGITALVEHTRSVLMLEDGELAFLRPSGCELTDFDLRPLQRAPMKVEWSVAMMEKDGYRHFMLKEIHEHPIAVAQTLQGRLERDAGRISLAALGVQKLEMQNIDRVQIVACGTSYYASLLGKYYIEKYARMPVDVELASEYRYRVCIANKRTLAVAVSQSGETADTLHAMKYVRDYGAQTLAIVNVPGSSIAFVCDAESLTHAGPEVGVASTKAFTAQVTALILLGLAIAQERGTMTAAEVGAVSEELVKVGSFVEKTLELAPAIEKLANKFHDSHSMLFIGRGPQWPVAMEGALKLKEISYIHAEGYAGGELKHGPIALIDENMVVVCIAPKDEYYEKTISNIEEIKARGGRIIAIGTEGDVHLMDIADEFIGVPQCSSEILPFLTTVPVHLFAYSVAVRKGTDVDQPRNLAKSVTVE